MCCLRLARPPYYLPACPHAHLLIATVTRATYRWLRPSSSLSLLQPNNISLVYFIRELLRRGFKLLINPPEIAVPASVFLFSSSYNTLPFGIRVLDQVQTRESERFLFRFPPVAIFPHAINPSSTQWLPERRSSSRYGMRAAWLRNFIVPALC